MSDKSELRCGCEQEIFKDITGFDGYTISNHGRIISYRKGKRELKPSDNGKGYLTVGLWDGQQIRTQKVHKLVAQIFNGAQKGQLVRHLDDDKKNNCYRNLAVGTVKDNFDDAVKNGKSGYVAMGESHANSKLTTPEVKEIKHLLAAGMSPSRICDIYNIGLRTLADIREGKTWSHVTIADVQQGIKWISVKERLPDYDCLCLVYSNRKGTTTLKYFSCTQQFEFANDIITHYAIINLPAIKEKP